jgi:predicted permease
MAPRPDEPSPNGIARELLRRLLPERAIARDVDEELRFHIEGRVRELQDEEGLGVEEARQRVLASFGDVDALGAECREIGREAALRRQRRELLPELAREVRLAARRLRRSPGFAGAAVLILALGVGASVAVFSVLYEVVLRPLAYQEPERLVRVWPGKSFNGSMVRYFERSVPAFEGVAGLSGWSFTLVGDDRTEQIQGAAVTPEYFDVLGVRPALGRSFLREEEHHENAGVVLLSHDFWQRRFGGDPDILGRELPLETFGRPPRHRVIGVLPPDFRPEARVADVWAPLQIGAWRAALEPAQAVASDSSWFVNEVVARLAPDATVAQASEQLRAAALRLRAEVPATSTEEEAETARAELLLDATVGEVRPVLWGIFSAAGMVLLIACANLSTLVVIRSSRGRGEAAVRAALGAGHARLLGERLIENGLLAALGGAAGVVLAAALLAAVRGGLVAAGLPRASAITLQVPALAFALAVSAGAMLLFALLPAFSSTRSAPGDALRGGPRPGATGARHHLDRGLVAAEVALATLLLFGAGLALRSLLQVLSTDPGFRTDGVIALSVEPPNSQLTTGAERRAFYGELEVRLAALPGVESVGAIHLLPLTDNNWSYPYLAEGHAPPQNSPLPSANFRAVSGGYFRTLEIPLLEGRAFDERDRQGEPAVVILNRRMAEDLWPNESAVGKEIRLFGSQPLTVVGVVGDVRQHTLELAPRPEMYLPSGQYSLAAMSVLIRAPTLAAGTLETLRELVWSVNPSVAVPRLLPLDQLVAESVAERRFAAQLLLGFGAVALLLAGCGVYGVTSYVVSLRVRELGLRLALGARPGQLGREALGWGLLPVMLGGAVGVVASLLAARLIAGLLYGVAPTDWATLAVVVALLGLVTLLANSIPARRAARLDPSEALRAE